jgi:hypothetical protein
MAVDHRMGVDDRHGIEDTFRQPGDARLGQP